MKAHYFPLILVSLLAAACTTTGNNNPLGSVASGTTKSGGKDTGLAVSAGLDAYKAMTLTDSDVKALGLKGIEQSDKQAKIAAKGKYAARLAKLTAKHKGEDGLKLNFKVYQTPEINAFASPDGSIRVYSGLMDLMTDDELHYVLGHEIGHVKLGHSLSAYRAEILTRAARKGVAASGTAAGDVARSQLGGLMEAAFNAQYSQDAERQADDYGLAFNKKYKYNQKAAVSALEKLAKLSGSQASIFSSHPAPAERAKRLSDQIAKN